MAQPSITSTESFAARAQRSEATRVMLWTVVLVGMLLLQVMRRWAGGLVMADNRLFFSDCGVLAVGIVCQMILLRVLGRANRGGVLLPGWLWRCKRDV